MDIAQKRLTAQGIIAPQNDDVAAIVGRLGAMQAQDYAGGVWSLGLRMKNPSLHTVEQAIANADIVRTWPMRGTLHFVASKDIHWMLQVLAARATTAARGRRITQLGLSDAVVDEAESVLRNELTGGNRILRGDVAPLLASKVKGMQIDNQHTQHLMRNFGERGVICFGPHAGKQPTFVLLDEWVKPGPEIGRADALGKLARLYFTSHGPASVKDFAGWGYITMADAKIGLALAKAELLEQEVGGTTYYSDLTTVASTNASVQLLPGFDEYILGYKDRSAMLTQEYSKKIVPGNNGMFLATIVIDGVVVGTWKRILKKDGVHVTLFPFEPLPKARQSLLETAIERYGAFLGLPATLD